MLYRYNCDLYKNSSLDCCASTLLSNMVKSFKFSIFVSVLILLVNTVCGGLIVSNNEFSPRLLNKIPTDLLDQIENFNPINNQLSSNYSNCHGCEIIANATLYIIAHNKTLDGLL